MRGERGGAIGSSQSLAPGPVAWLATIACTMLLL